jgi:hypothetical protein
VKPAVPTAVLQFRVIQWIMVAVLVWGGYLAVGAVRAPGNHATWRGLIILGCTLAFLGFWFAALSLRQQRLNREASEGK